MVIQWDNRKIPRSWFITVVMAGFWIVWTPVTLLATYCFFLSFGSWAFFFFGLARFWLCRCHRDTVEVGTPLVD